MSLVISNKTINRIETIVKAPAPDKRYCSLDAILILSLALAIIGTPKGVREAAKRIKRDCNPGGLLVVDLLLKSNDPLKMMRICLSKLEI
jgi:hypothetical protein